VASVCHAWRANSAQANPSISIQPRNHDPHSIVMLKEPPNLSAVTRMTIRMVRRKTRKSMLWNDGETYSLCTITSEEVMPILEWLVLSAVRRMHIEGLRNTENIMKYTQVKD